MGQRRPAAKRVPIALGGLALASSRNWRYSRVVGGEGPWRRRLRGRRRMVPPIATGIGLMTTGAVHRAVSNISHGATYASITFGPDPLASTDKRAGDEICSHDPRLIMRQAPYRPSLAIEAKGSAGASRLPSPVRPRSCLFAADHVRTLRGRPTSTDPRPFALPLSTVSACSTNPVTRWTVGPQVSR